VRNSRWCKSDKLSRVIGRLCGGEALENVISRGGAIRGIPSPAVRPTGVMPPGWSGLLDASPATRPSDAPSLARGGPIRGSAAMSWRHGGAAMSRRRGGVSAATCGRRGWRRFKVGIGGGDGGA
jgi:hypothetical protein